jgi:hypothetical protein
MTVDLSDEIKAFLHKEGSVVFDHVGFFMKLGIDEGEIIDISLYNYATEHLTSNEINAKKFEKALLIGISLLNMYMGYASTRDHIDEHPLENLLEIEVNDITNKLKLYESRMAGHIKKFDDIDEFLSKEYSPVKGDRLAYNYTVNYLGWNIVQLLMGPAIKMAFAGGEYGFREKELIRKSFVNGWGFNLKFIDSYMSTTKNNIESFKYSEYRNSTKKMLADFSELLKQTKFKERGELFNFEHFANGIIGFLEEIQMADNNVCNKEKEEMNKFKAILLG